MKKKIMAKILSIPFIIFIAVIWFNWETVVNIFSTTGTYLIILLCFLPIGYLIGEWINLKFKMKAGHALTSTKLKEVLKQEHREKNARECLNRHRMIDPNLDATYSQPMEIISREASPSRDDAVQWELFAFTTQEQYSNWNPVMGTDGIPSEFIFYVYVNCHTGEAYFRRFERYDDAVQKLDNLWMKGVKKHEASEFEKHSKRAFDEEMAKLAAHRTADDKKETGEKDDES